MAEMEVKGGGGHKKGGGVKKQKKLSTRVDLTPMVDLGFLLITFFMFATTLQTPTALKLTMPKDDVDEKDQNKMPEEGSFSILIGKDDAVFFYEGNDPSKLQASNFKEIRDKILDKKKRVRAAFGGSDTADKKNMMVVIKPTDDATNKNVVDLLDEMKINAIKLYAIVKPSDQEKQVVAISQGAAPTPGAPPAGEPKK
ncbi:MAG: biopolymer transporter ExbD [Dinghuibacter sp.]|nr:biopolymer transporter ExbD [Dinghuibacter sp.]